MTSPHRPSRSWFVGALAVLSLIAAACGGGAGSTEAGDAAPTAIIPKEDRKLAPNQNLVVRQYSEPQSFDPAFLFRIENEQIAINLYSGLTTYDPMTAEPIPDLAKSWEISPDGLTYTFALVDNAQWHDGSGVLTSADVKYSYERVMNPATGSTYRAEFANVASIEAPSDFVVVIKLKSPDANFLYQVGNNHQGQVVKQSVVERLGSQYARNPIGTGPFKLKEWVPNSTMVLAAHDGYFKGRPHLDTITFDLITDNSTAETALLNGEVSLASGVSGLSTEQFDRIRNTPGFVMHQSKDYVVNVWLFGPDVAQFKDARVRRAFGMAIDEETIGKTLTPYTSGKSTSILPPWMEVYDKDSKGLPYDPAGAQKLLADAGYANGFTVKYMSTSSTDALLLRQQYLAKVGIKLEIEIVEPAVYNSRRQSASFELSGRLYPAVNPDTLLFGYLHPESAAPAGLNSFKYSNPTLTTLLEKARASLDESERLDLYKQAQKLVADEVPYIPMTVSSNVWIGTDKVKNVQVNRLASVDFHPVYISSE